MDKIDRLKQLLLTHRTEDISKLTFEQRLKFDNTFAEEIVKLFTIPNVVWRSEQLVCPNCNGSDIETDNSDIPHWCKECGAEWEN